MQITTFQDHMRRLEINFGKKYTEEQTRFLWDELKSLTDDGFEATVNDILNLGKMRTLPNKADFVEFSGGRVVNNRFSGIIQPIHGFWGNDAREYFCECQEPWKHEGLFWERKETGKEVEHKGGKNVVREKMCRVNQEILLREQKPG